jgi:hypothetical protein
MSALAQALAAVVAVAAVLVVIGLVRARRLKERYAFIWLLLAVGMVGLVAARPLLDRISEALGIRSGTTTLFLLAILVVLGVLLQLSVSLSALEERVRDIAEAVALSVDSGEPVEDPDQR